MAKENNKLLINDNNLNALVIILKIRYFHPEFMKIIDDSFFKSLSNIPFYLL